MAVIKRPSTFKNLIHENYDEEIEVGDIDYWKENDQIAYETILDAHRDINTDFDWWEDEYSDFRDMMEKKFGWAPEDDEIAFSGFWSQGDGASFEGRMDNGEVAALLGSIYKKFPLNEAIEDGCVYADVSFDRSGRYVHEKSVTTNLELEVQDHERCFEILGSNIPELKGVKEYDEDECDEAIEEYVDGFYSELEDTIDDWRLEACGKLYEILRDQYEALTTDEQVEDTLRAIGYEFSADGEIQ